MFASFESTRQCHFALEKFTNFCYYECIPEYENIETFGQIRKLNESVD